MLIFGLLDIWVFQFNPMQKNIFLDQEKGSHYFNNRSISADPTDIDGLERAWSDSRASIIPPSDRFARSVTSDQAPPLLGKKVIDKDMFDALN